LEESEDDCPVRKSKKRVKPKPRKSSKPIYTDTESSTSSEESEDDHRVRKSEMKSKAKA
jgi:hypothetical protein